MRKTRKLSALFALLVLSFALVSCSRIQFEKVRPEAKKMNYSVVMTVSIDRTPDSTIFIRTNTFELDEKSMSITVKEGLLSEKGGHGPTALDSSAIKVEGARFSLPYGGKITITDKEGKEFRVLERYP